MWSIEIPVLDDDGLIGADVFHNYLVDIDFPADKFRLTPLPPYPDEAPAEASLGSESAAATSRARSLHCA
jgi:hypothetical protein